MFLRSAAWSALASTATVVGGAYLYSVYGPRKNRGPLGLAAGLLVGQQIGAMAGWALAGPAGLLTGSMTGGIAGAVLGHDAAASGPVPPTST
jgi:hypothetical protein